MSRAGQFRIAIRKFEPFESAIQKQWRLFDATENSGLQLEAQAFDLHDLTGTLFDRGGLKNGEWDIGFINTDWIASAHESHALLDLASYLKSNPPDGYPGGWTPSLLRLQEIDGQVLGLPYHDGPECLIYRKDLFDNPSERIAYQDRFGAPLQPPQTWEEFHQIARHFQRAGKGRFGTVFAAFPDGHNTVYDFLLQLWTRGGELVNEAGELRLDSREAVAALEFYREILNDPFAVHPRSRKMDSVKSGLAFAAGEAAMMVNWFGFAAMCETIPESKVRGRVAVAEIPHGAGGSTTSLNIYWLLAIGARTPHADLAYRFLRHCASASMDKLLTLEGAIGCRKSTWLDAEVNRAVPFYRELERFHRNARELPRLSQWPALAKVIDDLVLATIDTREPVDQLVSGAQRKIQHLAAGA